MANKKLAILFFLSVLLAFFAGYFSSTIIENRSSVYSSDIFTAITDIFEEYYYYDIDDEEVNRAFIASIEAIINQYAYDNDDPYTRLNAIPLNITPTDAEEFEGLGISFTFNEHQELLIYDVLVESSVYQVIYPNDIITGIVINEERLMFVDMTEDEVIDYMSGVEDEVKQLIVVNPNGDESIVDATYQRILTPTAEGFVISDDIAYIKISEFSAYQSGVTVGTAHVFNSLLVDLEDDVLTDESKTLIIDLRDNPGGALTALNNKDSSQPAGITQQLLVNHPEEPIFTMTNNLGEVTEFFGRLSESKAYDIKVLVNGHSASAAEVLAAALMEAGYELYGEETYGKGVYQNTTPLNPSSIMNVYYTITYTEGTWQYGDNLNIMDVPLTVNPIEQSGMYAIDMPVYTGEIGIDEVDIGLALYQQFFNVYFGYTGNDLIRTDGYFDHETEMAVALFQEDMGLTMTGVLNLSTSHAVYEYYKSIVNNSAEDAQLQALISLIEG